MLGDIAIMVFALIAIFTGKKWAIVTATIWAIIAFVLGFASGFIDPSNSLNSNITDNLTLTPEDKKAFVLCFFEILFIIVGWIRVILTKKKTLPPELN